MKYYDPGFYGTENYWSHPLWGFTYTDSVRHFCIEHKAYWIIDVIGSHYPKVRHLPFLLITFDISEEGCIFTIREDSDTQILIRQKIEYTDLEVSVRLFMEGNVLLFPSDH